MALVTLVCLSWFLVSQARILPEPPCMSEAVRTSSIIFPGDMRVTLLTRPSCKAYASTCLDMLFHSPPLDGQDSKSPFAAT
eukprot:10783365-Prorocentrum_lima.AAC.1